MTFEQLLEEYKKIVILEYREQHPDETVGLTDEQVLMCSPITYLDKEFVKDKVLFNKRARVETIKEKIADLKEEIDGDTATIENECNSFEASELRQDIRDNTIAVAFYEDLLQKALIELNEIEALDLENEQRSR